MSVQIRGMSLRLRLNTRHNDGLRRTLNFAFGVAVALSGCAVDRLPALVTPGATASDVQARMGKPITQGVLPNGGSYWDYTLQPFGYHNYRVSFAPDERVQAVQDLLTSQNIARVAPGMWRTQVLDIVGPSRQAEQYGNGTTSLSWRYDDYGVIKLLHVIFDASDRVQWSYSEWDPRVYSKKDGGHGK
jgi:outer membrane protein assembly factor BamE (lipoprotein component of BamABCDE complex)